MRAGKPNTYWQSAVTRELFCTPPNTQEQQVPLFLLAQNLVGRIYRGRLGYDFMDRQWNCGRMRYHRKFIPIPKLLIY